MFGVRDDEIEYPEIAAVASGNTEDDDETEELVDFSDVDYDDDDMEDERLGKTEPLSASKRCVYGGGRQSLQSKKEAKEHILTAKYTQKRLNCRKWTR